MRPAKVTDAGRKVWISKKGNRVRRGVGWMIMWLVSWHVVVVGWLGWFNLAML